MDQHPHDDIESFALGTLSNADADRLLDHADACPTCSVLLADAIQVVQELGSDIEGRPSQRPLGAHAWTNTVETRSSRSATIWPALAFTAMAAALLLFVWNLLTTAQKPVIPIALLVHSHFEHHALRGPSGSAKVIQALDGSWVYLLADGLSPRTTYTLWEEADTTTHPVGSLSSDDRGQAASYWEQPATKIHKVVLVAAGQTLHDRSALRWP